MYFHLPLRFVSNLKGPMCGSLNFHVATVVHTSVEMQALMQSGLSAEDPWGRVFITRKFRAEPGPGPALIIPGRVFPHFTPCPPSGARYSHPYGLVSPESYHEPIENPNRPVTDCRRRLPVAPWLACGPRVLTNPYQMKENRPSSKLRILSREDHETDVELIPEFLVRGVLTSRCGRARSPANHVAAAPAGRVFC